MSNWYVIAAAALAAIGILSLLYRGNKASPSRDDRQDSPRPRPDYPKDREAARLAHMSAEDRAWETASLQRDQTNRERNAALAQQSL